ncbi:unnamed protein product [Schistosoma margrebowiei]|uniref:Uncharacterized protein n=1 Tax=Schistosoma margrebowiei TaxID=48269 RepID=A0A3P8C3B0_9TREM|nr:unnamed protein product [Schistosoma margrebowiei]
MTHSLGCPVPSNEKLFILEGRKISSENVFFA